MKASNCGSIRFGVFDFNPQADELRKWGLKVKVCPQACKVLASLLEHPGQVRTREELRQRLWPTDTFVDFEHSLNKAIHALRVALGDSATSPRYIETVAGQGYRFIPVLQSPSQPLKSRPLRKITSVAVLPFVAAGAESEFLFLASQITSLVTNALSKISGICVLAHSTVKHCEVQDKSPQMIGRDLRVSGVVFGELVPRNGDLILNVEFIDVADGIQLWGAEIRQDCKQGIDCSEQVAREILRHLLPILSRTQRKVVSIVSKPASSASRRGELIGEKKPELFPRIAR
jgi:DNA-binding winged helix-turn-helix (wHTH) protein